MRRKLACSALVTVLLLSISACSFLLNDAQPVKLENDNKKLVIYQIFTRLFGNTNTTNKPWGSQEENGVGKFADITDKALIGIKELGVTHIWYTGVLHHALIADYTQYGIGLDDPDVVKGRAGSPYAVKDYYSVNPDLAINPANRIAEFEALIERTHQQGMKVMIDIVPNHVARNYHSLDKPVGVRDFGADDNVNQAYARDNNYYYVTGKKFKVPDALNNYQPLGGELHPLLDNEFDEFPAKWTGNGARAAQPHFHDWYETVKVNYGIKPDGSKDFAELPLGYELKGYQAHYEFWQQQDVPSSWVKFKDIALYWLDKGVDGFRYDMAEMVPYEFWSYMNSAIKMTNPEALLLAEVYNKQIYRDYIYKGKMDYLYDKVDFYDAIKEVVQGKAPANKLAEIQWQHRDIAHNLLHFLDNHDEQRLASEDFAGDANKGKPALVVSALISSSPMMIYFGQEVGEDGSEETGFGDPTRTTIFDYAGVPAHQRWMNDGAFDGGQLTNSEKELRQYYQQVLNFAVDSPAVTGGYVDIPLSHLAAKSKEGLAPLLSFIRYSQQQDIIVLANFSERAVNRFDMLIAKDKIKLMGLEDGRYDLIDQLTEQRFTFEVVNGAATLPVELAPLQSLILEVN